MAKTVLNKIKNAISPKKTAKTEKVAPKATEEFSCPCGGNCGCN